MLLPKTMRTSLVLVALLALWGTGAAAGDRPTCENKEHSKSFSIEVDDDDIIVTRQCDGTEKVVMMNLDALGEMVEDALGGAVAALEELDDMQLKIHLGEDNRLSFADAQTEWEVDLGQIANQVSDALEVGLEELDTQDWASSHDRHEIRIEAESDGDRQDLERELDALRQELKKLKQELKESASDRD